MRRVYSSARWATGAILPDPGRFRSGEEDHHREGLATSGKLDPVQEAFLKEEAFQCGYCTPGMIMSAVALLNSAPNHSEQDIIRRMNGNICRCGTYGRIIATIQKAASGKKAEAHG